MLGFAPVCRIVVKKPILKTVLKRPSKNRDLVKIHATTFSFSYIFWPYHHKGLWQWLKTRIRSVEKKGSFRSNFRSHLFLFLKNITFLMSGDKTKKYSKISHFLPFLTFWNRNKITSLSNFPIFRSDFRTYWPDLVEFEVINLVTLFTLCLQTIK